MTTSKRPSATPASLEEHRDLLDAGAVAISSGARAAGLLVDACRKAPEQSSLRFEVVRDLASDIERQLDALARSIGEDACAVDLLVEATLLCADLVTLAACNARELRPGAGTTVVHLSSGAARALGLLVEAGSQDLAEEHAENSLRDVRGAGWRVDLAVRQLDETPG
jgi:hypothetical protein